MKCNLCQKLIGHVSAVVHHGAWVHAACWAATGEAPCREVTA